MKKILLAALAATTITGAASAGSLTIINNAVNEANIKIYGLDGYKINNNNPDQMKRINNGGIQKNWYTDGQLIGQNWTFKADDNTTFSAKTFPLFTINAPEHAWDITPDMDVKIEYWGTIFGVWTEVHINGVKQ